MTVKQKKLPTILGIVLLFLGTFLGVYLVNKTQIFKIGADTGALPKDIRISNISDASLTISWITDKETAGFVLFDNKPQGQVTNKTFTHSVSVTGLSPEKTYQYKINSDGTTFDNKGVPWSASTGPTLGQSPVSNLISGTVITATGQPVGNALVYANIGGYLLSTLTSAEGSYVFQLGSVRTNNLGSFVTVDPSQTVIELFAQANSQDVSSAQIFAQSAKPAPAMVIGQTQDFKNLPPSKSGAAPSASLDLPNNATQASKFSVPDSLSTPPPQNVTLDNVKDGETVSSDKPQFFGTGPAGTAVSITVESQIPQEGSANISSSGSWSWTPPQNLAPGNHTITISWIDTAGITRTLTRNFVVQASELPAFEASSSGQTTTPSPTATAGTATPKATFTPSPTATKSSAPVPVTGDLTPTVLFTIMGMGVLGLSFAIWKYSNA